MTHCIFPVSFQLEVSDALDSILVSRIFHHPALFSRLRASGRGTEGRPLSPRIANWKGGAGLGHWISPESRLLVHFTWTSEDPSKGDLEGV